MALKKATKPYLAPRLKITFKLVYRILFFAAVDYCAVFIALATLAH